VEGDSPGVFLEALRQVFEETGIPLDAVMRTPAPRQGRRRAAVDRDVEKAAPRQGSRRAAVDRDQVARTDQVVTSVGITGGVRGNLVLYADYTAAAGILRGMTGGLALPAAGHGEFQRAALGELANQVAGRAVTLLAHAGVPCDITPPTVVTADLVTSLLPGPAPLWSVRGPFGELRLLVAVAGAKK